MKYIVLYQWYESTKLGLVDATNEKRAIIKFIIKELRQCNAKPLQRGNCIDSDLHFYFEDNHLLPQIRKAAKETEYFRVYPANEEFMESKY